MLSRIKFNLDNLSDEIKPIQEKILYNSRVGFAGNMTEINKKLLYLPIKNIMTPRILIYNANLDTLLIVQEKNQENSTFHNYRVIDKRVINDLIFSLVIRVK